MSAAWAKIDAEQAPVMDLDAPSMLFWELKNLHLSTEETT
jgi:hypothetical protein